MPIILPPPLDLYFLSENTNETEVLARCFSPHAIVSDEARTHYGIAAIAAWKTASKLKTGYVLEVVSAQVNGDRATVAARVAGSFPGSPATLSYAFTTRDGLIDVLEIK